MGWCRLKNTGVLFGLRTYQRVYCALENNLQPVKRGNTAGLTPFRSGGRDQVTHLYPTTVNFIKTGQYRLYSFFPKS